MRDKEERETEVVMEEGEVVMGVKQVIAAEVQVAGGKFLVMAEVEDVVRGAGGDMQVFSDVGKGKWDGW